MNQTTKNSLINNFLVNLREGITGGAAKFYGDILEPSLGYIGIGVQNHPFRRFVVVSGGIAVAVWILKPESLFTDKGEPKSLSITGENIEETVLL